MLEANLDLGVVNTSGWAGEPRLSIVPLATLPLVVAVRAGHPLARLRAPRVEQVLAYPIASPPIPAEIAANFARAYPRGRRDEHTGDMYTTLVVDSISMAQSIVEHSDAVMPVPLASIADSVVSGRLCVLDMQIPWLVVEFGVIYLAGRTPPPAARALVEALRSVANETHTEARHLAATLRIQPNWKTLLDLMHHWFPSPFQNNPTHAVIEPQQLTGAIARRCRTRRVDGQHLHEALGTTVTVPGSS